MVMVADVMDYCARQCSVGKQNGWVQNTTATAMELKDFLRETVDEILDRLDLPDPVTRETTLTGNGTADYAYALPDDFKRMVRDEAEGYELTGSRRFTVPINTNGAWTAIRASGAAGGQRLYRLYGDEDSGFKVQFLPTLETGKQITFAYVSTEWCRKSDGTRQAVWADDNDVLALPRDITELGVIWRFKRKKGLPFADLQADYEVRMSRRMNDSRGIRSIDMTGGCDDIKPMRVPVPDFIPPV